MLSLPVVAPVALRTLDVALLRALVPAAKQHHDDGSLSPEVHAMPRSRVDSQLEDAIADPFRIAEIPQAESGDSFKATIAASANPPERAPPAGPQMDRNLIGVFAIRSRATARAS